MLIDLLKQRFTTKNWDYSKLVTNEQIDYIIDCLNISPIKMGHPGYELVILTESEEGKRLKNWLFYEHSWTSDGNRAVDGKTKRDYKGQYLAPLLFCFFNNLNAPTRGIIEGGEGLEESNLPCELHRDANIFMSCMTAILAAEEMGLNTGITTCHDMYEVSKYFGMPNHKCTMALGIGYAFDQTELLLNDGWYTDVLDPDTDENLGILVANIPAWCEKPARVFRPDMRSITKFI
jgi:nitroreductase